MYHTYSDGARGKGGELVAQVKHYSKKIKNSSKI